MKPTPRRQPGWLAGTVVALVIMGVIVLVVPSRRFRTPDPMHRGRSASEWFTRMVRSSPDLSEDSKALIHLDARAALLQLGTNAVPLLVDRALVTAQDTSVHAFLRETVRPFRRFVSLGQFLSPQTFVTQSLDLLGLMRPPVAQVWPQVEAHLQAGGRARHQATEILSRCLDDGSIEALLLKDLSQASTNDAWLHVERLARLQPPPAHALSALVEALPHPGVRDRAAPILCALGDRASHALPALERLSSPIPSADAIFGAILMLEIAPEHPPSRAALNAWSSAMSFDPWNQLAPAWKAFYGSATGQLHPIRNAASISAFESFAQLETAAWEPRGLAHVASTALEPIAPERAAPLYAAQMNPAHRETVQIIAAGSLLRVQRTNTLAFSSLTGFAVLNGHLARMAATELRETSPDWPEALAAIRNISSNAPEAGARSAAEVSLKTIEVRALEQAFRHPESSGANPIR